MKYARNMTAAMVLGLSILGATPARAEADARTFLQRIDAGDEMYLQILNGYANGMEWSNTYLGQLRQPKMFCVPGNLRISAAQNADILRRHITTDARAAAAPAGLALLMAYRAEFPCPAR